MIKSRTQKLIVLIIILVFGVGLFLSVNFIKNQITQATHPEEDLSSYADKSLDMDAWSKIEHRFR